MQFELQDLKIFSQLKCLYLCYMLPREKGMIIMVSLPPLFKIHFGKSKEIQQKKVLQNKILFKNRLTYFT